MRKAASTRKGARSALAETEQSQGVGLLTDAEDGSEPSPLTRAELEAAFAMFGTPASPEHGEWVGWPPSFEPANDATAERRMPALTKRGLHLDPKLPIQFMKLLDWVMIAAAAEVAA